MQKALAPALTTVLCLGVIAVSWANKESALHRRTKPNILTRESARRLSVSIADGTGRDTVVQALDYLCPPCHAQEAAAKRLRGQHASLEWRVLPYPLEIHSGADRLAQMLLDLSTTSERQRLHDGLMTNSDPLGAARVAELSPAEVQRLRFLRATPVSGTPTYFCYRHDGASAVCSDVSAVESFLYETASESEAPSAGCKAETPCAEPQ